MRPAVSTDYGLRVLMRLADDPDQPSTTARIAEEFQIPYNHLAKVVQALARGGFVTTQRGSRSEEHTSELQSRENLVCRLLLEKKKQRNTKNDMGGQIRDNKV